MADNTCVCGHLRGEHGHDKKRPGSMACGAARPKIDDQFDYEPCDCIAYETDDDE
jgi:hypothetical protein